LVTLRLKDKAGFAVESKLVHKRTLCTATDRTAYDVVQHRDRSIEGNVDLYDVPLYRNFIVSKRFLFHFYDEMRAKFQFLNDLNQFCKKIFF